MVLSESFELWMVSVVGSPTAQRGQEERAISPNQLGRDVLSTKGEGRWMICVGRKDGDESKGDEGRGRAGQNHSGERQLNRFYWQRNGVVL